MDGLLGSAVADLPVPGLSADRPISPSAIETLLRCPYAFVLGNVLGFEEPASPPPLREIGQPYYGTFFHAVAADFYQRHGISFCSRERRLGDWMAVADHLVERSFEAFLRQYPLVGEVVRAQQRERLRRDLRELLEYDWNAGATERRFVAAERSFGSPQGVELTVGGRSLFVRGRLDRLDVEGRTALVRDLKTGRAHPRIGKEEAPAPERDLQIAVYGLVARILADPWRIPQRIAAAYAYVGRAFSTERSYRDDFHEVLEPEALRWLGIAQALLERRLFPRTPDQDDCTYCTFRPVCGDAVHDRAARVLEDAGDTLRDFRALKVDETVEDEEG